MQSALQHKTLKDDWKNFSLAVQMANIGSEVERSIKWKEKKQPEYAWKAFCRALELMDFTVEHHAATGGNAEIFRVREAFCDYFVGDNVYGSTKESWQKYFGAFSYLAAKERGVA